MCPYCKAKMSGEDKKVYGMCSGCFTFGHCTSNVEDNCACWFCESNDS